MSTSDIHIDVAADPRLLRTLRSAVRSYLTGFGFPDERIDECVLAVDEACTNSIRHAYGGDTAQRFEVELSSDAAWVAIVIRDTGRPAPADKLEKKDEAPPPDESTVTPGGLGVQLIHQVFDQVEFCPGDDRGNCVTMRLRRPNDNAGQPAD